MLRNPIESSLVSLYQVSKSRFVEMFGLPGLSHNSWKMRKIKSFCDVNPSKKSLGIIDDDLYVSFIPMAAVSDSGDINKDEIKKYSEVKKGFSSFRNNDVLFAKITPCMENGKGAVVSGLCNNIGFGSTEFHVLRANSDICNPYWLYYLIHLKNFRYRARMNMTGSAGQKRVPASFLENFMVSLPPKNLQDEYVSFAKHLDKLKVILKQIDEKIELLKKSRFVEMFGDPILESNNLKISSLLADFFDLKAGDFTPARDISVVQNEEYPYPCFGGNGIRGYVDNYTKEGFFPIIGRQGALCGNVNLTFGKFRNTEHAVLVTPKIQVNTVWLFKKLELLNLNRLSIGAAQPGLSICNLNRIPFTVPSIDKQNKYAEIFKHLDKLKVAIHKELELLE